MLWIIKLEVIFNDSPVKAWILTSGIRDLTLQNYKWNGNQY